MRLDLHNHTITASREFAFQGIKSLGQKNSREIYLQTTKYHRLDGVAITNLHEIKVAQSLSHEYPDRVIVGAEYRVLEELGASLQVVVLNVDTALHSLLMNARLRGIAYFSQLLREKNLVFFLGHVGWGIPVTPYSTEIFEGCLSHFDAIEVLNAFDSEANDFALALARYYHMAPIGGSGYLVSDSTRRAYTSASGVDNMQDFLNAIRHKQVEVGMTDGKSFGVWQAGKDFYRREIGSLWHSGFHLEDKISLKELAQNLGKNILLPALKFIPQLSQLHHHRKRAQKQKWLQEHFVDYLKHKETKRIFALSLPPEEKKTQWIESISRINNCFRESGVRWQHSSN